MWYFCRVYIDDAMCLLAIRLLPLNDSVAGRLCLPECTQHELCVAVQPSQQLFRLSLETTNSRGGWRVVSRGGRQFIIIIVCISIQESPFKMLKFVLLGLIRTRGLRSAFRTALLGETYPICEVLAHMAVCEQLGHKNQVSLPHTRGEKYSHDIYRVP